MPRWLKQLISYVISVVVLALVFKSYTISCVLLGAIAFHECGHLYAAKMMGLRTKGFYLIPFIGGAALIADRYKRYSQMSFVLIAGPLVGTVGAIACYVLYLLTGSVFIGASAAMMAWLNLFNLIPLAMLDGGQLAEAIVYSINETLGTWFITISYVVGAYVVWQFNPFVSGMIAFIGVPVVFSAWRRLSLSKKGLSKFLAPNPQEMNLKEIALTLLSYIGTALVLVVVIHLCHTHHLNISTFFKR